MLISAGCTSLEIVLAPGGNIAHHMGMRYGQERLPGINVAGTVLIHPYFWGKERIGNEVNEREAVREGIDALWHVACPLRLVDATIP